MEEKWGRIRIQDSRLSEAHGGQIRIQDSGLSEARQWWSKFGSDPHSPVPRQRSHHHAPRNSPPAWTTSKPPPSASSSSCWASPASSALPAAFPTAPCSTWKASSEAVDTALTAEPGGALQYGATEGYEPLREQLSLLHGQQGRGRGRRRPDRHHRQPAGAGPAGQDHDQPRRQGDRRGAHLPGHHPVLPALWRRADHRARSTRTA